MRDAGYIGKYDRLLDIVEKRKFGWFGHVVRATFALTDTILLGKVEGKISLGRPTRQWLDDIKECSRLTTNDMWRLYMIHMIV